MTVRSVCVLAVVASVFHVAHEGFAGKPADEVATHAERTAHAPKLYVMETAKLLTPPRSSANVTQRGWWAAATGKIRDQRPRGTSRPGAFAELVIPQLGLGAAAIRTRVEGLKTRGLQANAALVEQLAHPFGTGLSAVRGIGSSSTGTPETPHRESGRGDVTTFGFGAVVRVAPAR